MKLNKTIRLVTLLITGVSQAKTAGKFYMLIDDGKGFVDACELKLALPTKTEKNCKVAVIFQNSDR